MIANQKVRLGVVNLLIAIAISLIVNFSYFVFSIMSSSEGRRFPSAHSMPDMQLFISLQVVYYIVLAFVLLSLLTMQADRDKGGNYRFVRRMIACAVVTFIFYFFTPASNKAGEIIFTLNSNRLFNPMTVLKSSFTIIVAGLYGKIYELIYRQQHIVIENQILKTENIENRYNMLVGQINPHFFFNSLNSLSMLVRNNHKEKAITYIDQLSDTFRYIIQNGKVGMTTLGEELKFLDAYKYLHEIRYADKLFFDIEVDDAFKYYKLPTLSLQPLIENAVKHNTITSAKPFSVKIRTEDRFIVVSNPLIPKIEPADGTGIGLKNMSSRYLLLTGHDIIVEKTATHFIVKLPLTDPLS